MKYVVKVEKWAEIEVEADTADDAEAQVADMEGDGSLWMDMVIEATPLTEESKNG